MTGTWFIHGIFGGSKGGPNGLGKLFFLDPGPRFAHLGILHSNMSHTGEEQVSHYKRFRRFVLLGLHHLSWQCRRNCHRNGVIWIGWFTSGLYAPQDPQNFPRRLSGTIMNTCNACSSDNTSKTQTGKQTQQPTKSNKQQEKIQGRYMYRYIT